MTSGAILSPDASSDIDGVARYLSLESLDLAHRFYEAFFETLDGLVLYPRKGRIRGWAHSKLESARSWPVAGFEQFLVFYQPTESGIYVLRVLHGAMDLDRRMSENL